MRTPVLVLLAFAFPLTSGACGRAESERVGQTDERLIDGVVTTAHPEIGLFFGPQHFCSGTLIAPNAVLSAAHCVDYQSGPLAGVFEIRVPPGTTSEAPIASNGRGDFFAMYPTSEVIVLGHDLGDDDIAVIHLTTSVPPSIAVPLPLASRHASDSDRVTAYGYGGTAHDCAIATDYLTKRSYSYRFGDNPRQTCPGDSGGAVLNSADEIVQTISGWRGRADIDSDVPKHRDQILQQLATWVAAPTAACGNGICEPGESDVACPQDCCGPNTRCDQVRAGTSGQGSQYCRSMTSPTKSTGGYAWVTVEDALAYCSGADDVCQSTYACGGSVGFCMTLPNGWWSGAVPSTCP